MKQVEDRTGHMEVITGTLPRNAILCRVGVCGILDELCVSLLNDGQKTIRMDLKQ